MVMQRSLETLEFVGGELCLDFTNTINSRLSPEHDYLRSISDLVNWLNLQPDDYYFDPAIGVSRHTDKDTSEKMFELAIELRELLYSIFSTLGRGEEIKKADLHRFNHFYKLAEANAEIKVSRSGSKKGWGKSAGPERLLFPIVESAAKLLLSEELLNVKECPGCGWLFLDTTKNKSRKWCSMNTCGARDKMRRYHRRKRKR
jgi:predicted RNA-binding Zn ribbon-like protein